MSTSRRRRREKTLSGGAEVRLLLKSDLGFVAVKNFDSTCILNWGMGVGVGAAKGSLDVFDGI